MKKTVFALAFLMLSSLIFAQAQDSSKHCKKPCTGGKDEIRTIFQHPDRGGFFSIYGGMADISGQSAVMAGLRFGATLDHWFSYGLGGSLLISQMSFDNILINKSLELEMGYAGLFFEPTIAPKSPFHFSFPVLFGVGSAAFYDPDDQNFQEHNSFVTIDNDIFYIIEPGAELELNMTKHTRLSLGIKYRYISDLSIVNTKEDAFNGLYYGLTLKFGKF
jgi:hypothetical protein